MPMMVDESHCGNCEINGSKIRISTKPPVTGTYFGTPTSSPPAAAFGQSTQIGRNRSPEVRKQAFGL